MEALQIINYFCKRCPKILNVTEEELLINEVVHSLSPENSKPPETQTGVCIVAKLNWEFILSRELLCHYKWFPLPPFLPEEARFYCKLKTTAKEKSALSKSGWSVLTFHPWMYHRFVFWKSVTVIWINMEQLMDWRSYVQLFSNLFLS